MNDLENLGSDNEVTESEKIIDFKENKVLIENINLTKQFIINLPIATEIPSELYSFSLDENALLLKLGTNIIVETKHNLLCNNNKEYINKYKTELTAFYEDEIEECKNKVKMNEYEYGITLKNQEKSYETIIAFYKENTNRFDKVTDEFKIANIHLQNELKSKNAELTDLKNTLIKNMSDEALKRDELMQKLLAQKNQSTIQIGNKGEFLFQEIANETFRDFPEYDSKHVGERGHLGDVHLFFKDFNILCDSKLHKAVVGKTHREQIRSDLQRNTKFKFAWLISFESGVCKHNQAPFIFEPIVDDDGDKLYICYINNLSSTENKQELLRSVWYSCKTLYEDVIKKQNQDGELKQLKVFKENTLKTLDTMIKTSREMNDNIKMLQQTKQVLDDAIKSINNNNCILSINDEYNEIVKQWWKSNIIKINDNSNIKSNKIYNKFKKDNNNIVIPADDFKKIVLSIVDDNDIIQPTYKGGFIGIKNISLQP